MFKDTYEGQTHYVGDNCNPPHPPMENKNTWQERFDELFPTLNFSGEPNEESDRLTGCFTKDTATLPIEIKSFLHQEIDLAVKRREGELNDCACKEKWTFGVVHRKDNPCYYPPRDNEDTAS